MESEMSDETEEQSAPGAPAPTPDAFTAVLGLIELVRNEAAFKRKLQGLHRALAAVDEGEKKLAAARTAFEEHEKTVRTEHAEERAALRKRQIAVQIEEEALVTREEHIRTLELAWKHLGEPADVQSGFREPEFTITPLQKAQRAFAQQPVAELPLRSGFDGGEFPADTTITRQPESPAGVRISRKIRPSAIPPGA
jgi:hypothetical protein